MPIVHERIDSRSGSIDSKAYTFFPYALLGSSGGGSSGAEEQPGGGVLVSMSPLELLAIQAAQGGVLAAIDDPPIPGSGGSGGSGATPPCNFVGEGFLFTQTGRYQRRFHVYTEACEGLLNARTARDAVGIPLLGEPFPIDPYSLAVSKEATSEPDDPAMWYVTVEYSPEGNPLLEPWDIETDFTTFGVAATKDKDGQPITNSVGDAFDPVVEIDSKRFQLRITRNVHFWSLSRALDYFGTINAAPVRIGDLILAARTMKLIGWNASAFQHLGRRFWRETLVVEYDPLTWDLKVANLGYRNAEGRPASSDGFVANFAAPLDEATGEFLNPGEQIQYREFKVLKETGFCVLRLNYVS